MGRPRGSSAGVGLGAFMDALGLDDADVASATGIDRSTISRIRRGKTIPRGDTCALLSEWAESEARRRGVPVRKRLTWGSLIARSRA